LIDSDYFLQSRKITKTAELNYWLLSTIVKVRSADC